MQNELLHRTIELVHMQKKRWILGAELLEVNGRLSRFVSRWNALNTPDGLDQEWSLLPLHAIQTHRNRLERAQRCAREFQGGSRSRSVAVDSLDVRAFEGWSIFLDERA